VTWDRFLWVVTARQYQMFAFSLSPADIPARLGTWALLLGDQFGWWGLALAIIGGYSWWQRDRTFCLFSSVWILVVAVYAFFYNTGDAHVYLVPVLLLLALWWGEGARWLAGVVAARRPSWRRAALIAVALLPLLSLALHWQAADPDDDWVARDYVDQVLAAAEPGALLVVRGDVPTFNLWYGVYVEHPTADVAIVSGPLLAYVWYREHVRYLYPDLVVSEPTGVPDVTIHDLTRDLILDNQPFRPVYVTDPAELWEPWFDFEQVADSPLYRPLPKEP
jgi:hypothetical protein